MCVTSIIVHRKSRDTTSGVKGMKIKIKMAASTKSCWMQSLTIALFVIFLTFERNLCRCTKFGMPPAAMMMSMHRRMEAHQAAASTVTPATTLMMSQHRRQAPAMTRKFDSPADSCVTDDFYAKKISPNFKHSIFSKTFSNDSHTNITVLWTGDDDSVIMVITLSNDEKPSTFYVSDNFGKTFSNLTEHLNGTAISRIHQNPVDRKSVFFVGKFNESTNASAVFMSSDGRNVNSIAMAFNFGERVIFHPTDPLKILTLSGSDLETKKAWLSLNSGSTWKLVHEYVNDLQWNEGADENTDTFYFTNSSSKEPHNSDWKREYDLVRAFDGGVNFRIISQRVRNFKIVGKFLYALVFAGQEQKKSILRVSTNGGLHWNEAQIPVMAEDRFYKILDMSDGMVFIHVDNPAGNGRGVLFSSGSDGIVFSESLRNHLYPKENGLNDFYKVQSMRGVYTTSLYTDDHKIQTRITFNRGAKWTSIRKPVNVDCFSPDKSKCTLQLASQIQTTKLNYFSASPLSTRSAIGVIMAHGHMGDAFGMTDPDVFVSTDGGYNWTRALNGPHLFSIADHGGLLVAVPDPPDHTADVVKFSLDEGQTWYCQKFSPEKIHITGLLTDPESWSLKVGIWGYGLNDSVWRVNVIDFEPLIGRKCKEPEDFLDFVAHSEMSKDRPQEGCLLGTRETFRRVKKGSRCYMGQTHVVSRSLQHCPCTEDDFECDYGFSRTNNWSKCVENPRFKGAELDICLDGEEKKIVTAGYRKIPGDVCEGGFNPGERYEANIKVKCKEGDKFLMGSLHAGPAGSASGLVVLIILIIIMTGFIFGMSVFFIRKFHSINTSPVAYRYSRLSQDEESRDDETMCIVTSNLASDETMSSSDNDSEPATLLIDTCDSTDVVTISTNGISSNRAMARKMYDESDEELLQ